MLGSHDIDDPVLQLTAANGKRTTKLLTQHFSLLHFSYLLQDAYYATVASLVSPVAELSLEYFT